MKNLLRNLETRMILSAEEEKPAGTLLADVPDPNVVDDKKADPPADEKKDEKVVLPESYTFAKIKTKDADGKDVESDVAKEIADPVAAFAKEQGLTQVQAQKLLDREIKLQEDANVEFQKLHDDQVKTWREEARKDPVLGAGNFDENMGIAKGALKEFFPGLHASVGDHAFLDHPAILRGLYLIGKKISEDNKVIRGNEPEKDGDPAANFFPSMKKKSS